jgi:hypothetical protein
MGVRSHFKRQQDVVELRETTTSQAQVTSTSRRRPDSIAPIQHVAPVFEPEVLSSRENVRPRVEHTRASYIRAADNGLPHPITILEGEAQPLSTATSETPSRTRPPTMHGKDDTPTSQSSSALGENDYLRPTTPIFSNRTSIYPTGDFRNSSMPDINDMKTEIMCNYLHQQQLKKMWSNGSHEEGVLLKRSKDDYTCCPPDLQLQRNGLFDAVKKLNVRVCRYAQSCATNTDFAVCNDRQYQSRPIIPTAGR